MNHAKAWFKQERKQSCNPSVVMEASEDLPMGVAREGRGAPLHISDICGMLNSSLMKRAALYMRVSTLDQHPESQLYDLQHSPDDIRQ